MCVFSHPQDPCSHSECAYFYQRVSEVHHTTLSPETLTYISKSLSHQTALMFQLSSTNEEVAHLLQSIIGSIQHMRADSTYATKSDFVLPEETNLDTLLSDIHQQEYLYTLQLTQKWPVEVKKERGFALRFQLVDYQTALPDETRFRLALYTAELTPKRLTSNIGGRKVIRGSTEAYLSQEGQLNFPNIVVNEVSSHYFNERLQFVVYCCSSSARVRPFVMENLQVRARRSRPIVNYDF